MTVDGGHSYVPLPIARSPRIERLSKSFPLVTQEWCRKPVETRTDVRFEGMLRMCKQFPTSPMVPWEKKDGKRSRWSKKQGNVQLEQENLAFCGTSKSCLERDTVTELQLGFDLIKNWFEGLVQ